MNNDKKKEKGKERRGKCKKKPKRIEKYNEMKRVVGET